MSICVFSYTPPLHSPLIAPLLRLSLLFICFSCSINFLARLLNVLSLLPFFLYFTSAFSSPRLQLPFFLVPFTTLSFFFLSLQLVFAPCHHSENVVISCAVRLEPNQLYLFSAPSPFSVRLLIRNLAAYSPLHPFFRLSCPLLLLLSVSNKFLRLFLPYLLFLSLLCRPSFPPSTPRPQRSDTSSPVSSLPSSALPSASDLYLLPGVCRCYSTTVTFCN